MDHTRNYALTQWSVDDRVLMEDFNADNAKIDAAIRAQADGLAAESNARTSADAAQQAVLNSHTAALAKLGNCQVYTSSYTGSGVFGEDKPNSLTFPYPPAVVFVVSHNGFLVTMIRDNPRALFVNNTYGYIETLAWNGNTVSWYSDSVDAQFNRSGNTYHVAALCAKS